MKILAVGGGSGGHVTPVAAVLREIKKLHPRSEIRFWCDSKFASQAGAIMGHLDFRVKVGVISAGKLRRYHHLTVVRQLFWPSLVLANVKDAFLVCFGFFESLVRLVVWRPDVIFFKGGYVCLPVGVAAYLLRIPYVVHDSDAHPGLTNRILSRHAKAIATGAPLEYYDYKSDITKYVGIPISSDFRRYDENEKKAAKGYWGINDQYPLVVVTGGGLGAKRINDVVAETLDDLLKFCSVVLISGEGQYDELRSLTPADSDRFMLCSFVSKDMAKLIGAADVVVARAGATTILELAAAAKPTILIPNAKLTGGHQLKNAAVYLKESAVISVNEDEMVKNPRILTKEIKELLSDSDKAKNMADKLHSFSKPNAARDVANMVVSSGRK